MGARPESEAVKQHEHGGFTFRNQPLGYWLAYVRTSVGGGALHCAASGAARRPGSTRSRTGTPSRFHERCLTGGDRRWMSATRSACRETLVLERIRLRCVLAVVSAIPGGSS